MSDLNTAYYDVVVCGGGAGGVGAAIGAAKAGAKVCLVEKYGFLGGAATTSQVLAYCGLYQQGKEPVQAVSGVAEELLTELRTLGLSADPHRSETTGNWIVMLDTELLKLALDRLLRKYQVDIHLHTRCAAVSRTGKDIEAVTLAGMEGRSRVVAEAFVDASGDANLAMLTGVDYQIGNREHQLQALTMPLRIGGVDPSVKINRAMLKEAIGQYNLKGQYPIARTDGGILIRLPLSRDLWWMLVDLPLTDLTSRSFTTAEMNGREMAHDYLAMLKTLPGCEQAYLVATGPQVGVRETRHPQSRYTITREDILEGVEREDSVARAAWPIELHAEAGKPVYHSIGGRGYAHIPYNSLRAKGVDNLWYAGRVIGADDYAYGSVRVMGTAFATGQAAGVAAADFADRHHVSDVASVQKQLLDQGAML